MFFSRTFVHCSCKRLLYQMTRDRLQTLLHIYKEHLLAGINTAGEREVRQVSVSGGRWSVFCWSHSPSSPQLSLGLWEVIPTLTIDSFIFWDLFTAHLTASTYSDMFRFSGLFRHKQQQINFEIFLSTSFFLF